MATLYTTEATAQVSTLLKDRVSNDQTLSGQVRVASCLYTMTGSEAANDLIAICSLPVGARLMVDLCRVSSEACGGTGTAIATLGDIGDDDRYSATSISLTSAATTAVTPTAAIGLTPYSIAAGNEIIYGKLALSSGSTTAGKLVRFRIVYILP